MNIVEPLFPSVEAALAFAYRHSHGDIVRPLMNRMADGPARGGSGLVGLDAAAQAGLILSAVRAAGELAEALTMARYGHRKHSCTHCRVGFNYLDEWMEAIDEVTSYVAVALPPRKAQIHIRKAIVMRYFGEKGNLSDIAQRWNVDKNTASAHANAVTTLLKGEEGRLRSALAERLMSAEIPVI